MKPKTIKITYWILTVLFALATLFDAIGGITREQHGVDGMRHLGYPLYLMTMLGVAKLLGIAALLQNRQHTLKDWAYAGFCFSFIGAFWSRAAMGDGIGLLLPPVIMLVYLFVLYYFWKKYLAVR